MPSPENPWNPRFTVPGTRAAGAGSPLSANATFRSAQFPEKPSFERRETRPSRFELFVRELHGGSESDDRRDVLGAGAAAAFLPSTRRSRARPAIRRGRRARPLPSDRRSCGRRSSRSRFLGPPSRTESFRAPGRHRRAAGFPGARTPRRLRRPAGGLPSRCSPPSRPRRLRPIERREKAPRSSRPSFPTGSAAKLRPPRPRSSAHSRIDGARSRKRGPGPSCLERGRAARGCSPRSRPSRRRSPAGRPRWPAPGSHVRPRRPGARSAVFVEAARVPEVLPEIRQHPIQHPRIEGRRCVPVEVDAALRHVSGYGPDPPALAGPCGSRRAEPGRSRRPSGATAPRTSQAPRADGAASRVDSMSDVHGPTPLASGPSADAEAAPAVRAPPRRQPRTSARSGRSGTCSPPPRGPRDRKIEPAQDPTTRPRACGHPIDVADLLEDARLAVGHDLGQAARPRADDRHAARHGFERREPERLAGRRAAASRPSRRRRSRRR